MKRNAAVSTILTAFFSTLLPARVCASNRDPRTLFLLTAATQPYSLRENNSATFYLTLLSLILALCFAVLAASAALRTSRKNKALRQAQASLVSLSELQRVNDELRESSVRLGLALSSANSCAWEIDLQSKQIIYDAQMNDVLEFDDLSPMSLTDFSAFYRSTVLDTEDMRYGDVLADFLVSDNVSRDIQILTRKGNKKYVTFHAKRYLDPTGHPVKIFGMILDKTAQVEAVNNAQEIAVRILNSIDEQIYVSDIETDELYFVNDTMLKQFGIQEYAGRKCWDLFMHLDERCSFCPKYVMARDRTEPYCWENVQPLLNIHSRHIDKYIQWVDGHPVLLHVMFDITDIRNAEKALQLQFEQEKLIADVSASLIQFGNFDTMLAQALEKIGVSFDCSRAYLAVVSPDEQSLQPRAEWISPQTANQLSSRDSADLHPGTLLHTTFVENREPYIFLSPDLFQAIDVDSYGLQSGIAAAFLVDNVFAGVLVAASDEVQEWSPHKIQAIQLLASIFAMLFSRNRIAERLVEAKEAAEQANLAKSQFLSTMSHEIRTPLNAIIGYVQVLQHKELGPEVQQRLQEISGSSAHLLSIINDILDMSKIEAGKVVLAPEPVNMLPTLQEVARMFEQRAADSGLTFTCDFQNLDGLCVECDKLLLKQILINLLSNAVKFTARGGTVTFRAKATPAAGGQAALHFEVVDTGIGMNEAQLHRLFQPFEQTSRDVTSLYGGTGLGLAISQKLTEMMGGHIQVKSKLEAGSRFWLNLQFKTSVASAPASNPIQPINADFTGKRILIVEDLPINRVILIELLTSTGALFDEAENGQIAVDKYTANPEGYDLILMDMLMPVMGGLDATRKIRERDHLRSTPVPILALTANAFQEDVAACLQAGMQGHISKPVNYDELVSILDRFLS